MSTVALSRVPGVVVFELILAAIGAAAVTTAIGYGITTDEGEIGPGFLPVVAGAILAVAVIVDAVRKLATQDDAPAIADGGDDLDIYGRDGATRQRQLWMVTGLTTATVALVGILGFLFAFALLVISCAVLVEHRRLVPSIVTAVLVVAGVWLVFVLGLGIPLPTGFLTVR